MIMLFEESGFHGWVRGMIYKLNVDAHVREDLMQIARIYLWRKETKYPGRKLVWYLKSCRRHILDFLRQGRSIDSLKRHSGRVVYTEWPETEPTDGDCSAFGVEDNPLSQVYAEELLRLLVSKLPPQERIILRERWAGLSVREIAQALKIAHQNVTRHCQHIKVVARQNGVAPRGIEKFREK